MKKYSKISNFINLTETPDRIETEKRTYSFQSKDAYTFGYCKDEFRIVPTSESTHIDLFVDKWDGDYNSLSAWKEKRALINHHTKLKGRFWSDGMLVSFWDYMPTNKELDMTIDNIITDLNLKNSRKDFFIEIQKNSKINPNNRLNKQDPDDDIISYDEYIDSSNHLTESPDYTYEGNSFKDKDAYTFGYHPETDEFGIKQTINPNMITYHTNLFPDIQSRHYLNFPGRFWENNLMISIWGKMPTKQEMQKLIRDIKSELGLQDPDNSFMIEMPSGNETTFMYNSNNGKSVSFKNYIPPSASRLKEPKQEPESKPERQKSNSAQFKLDLNEWPDEILNSEYHTDYSAIPFGYFKREIYDIIPNLHLGISGKTHSDSELKPVSPERISGRIFLKSKVMTFWTFPKNLEELREVIDVLNSELDNPNSDFAKKEPIDDTWQVDINKKSPLNILIPIKYYRYEATLNPERYKEKLDSKLNKSSINKLAECKKMLKESKQIYNALIKEIMNSIPSAPQ